MQETPRTHSTGGPSQTICRMLPSGIKACKCFAEVETLLHWLKMLFVQVGARYVSITLQVNFDSLVHSKLKPRVFAKFRWCVFSEQDDFCFPHRLAFSQSAAVGFQSDLSHTTEFRSYLPIYLL